MGSFARHRIVIVFSTFPDKDVAEGIVERLLSSKLIACGSVYGPVTSSYWWRGKIERSQEFQALMKAPEENYNEIEAFIKKEHPYDVPEVFSVKAEQVEEKYEKWLIDETRRFFC